MSKVIYNPWPIGKLSREQSRPELDEVKSKGYNWNDPRDIINTFEKKIAEYTGAKYAVVVDCCSNGLFLCLKYLKASGTIKIPKNTYVSVPQQIIHAGCKVEFTNEEWHGSYQLHPYNLFDSAVRWTEGMYQGNMCLEVISFQIKKRLPIGRGGVIITDDKVAADWLKLARYDGRNMSLPYTDPNHVMSIGYHMYMTPEDAARGILLMDLMESKENPDPGCWKNYPDLTKYKINWSSYG